MPPSSPLRIHTLVFISSDSSSATRFRAFEDGFAAYAASKSALNQGLRHLAAELPRLAPLPSSPLTLPAPTPSPSLSPGYGIPTSTSTATTASTTTNTNTSSSAAMPTTTYFSSSAPPTHHAHQQHPNAHTVVLALHPGEVATDMATSTTSAAALAEGSGSNSAGGGGGGGQVVSWAAEEVEGIISPAESVRGMLRVIEQKGWGGVHERGGQQVGVATFWDWEGRAYPW